jgi:hypothetical protein
MDLAAAFIHQLLKRAPGIDQRHARIVLDVPENIPWVLIVTRLEGKGRVDQVAIDVVHLQASATGFERRQHALWAMVGVPQFGGDEQVFAAGFAGAR